MDPYYLVGYVRRQHDAIAYAMPATSTAIFSDQWKGDDLNTEPQEMTPTTHHAAIVSILKAPVGSSYVLGLCSYEQATKFILCANHVLAAFTDDKVQEIIQPKVEPVTPVHPPAPTMEHHAGQILTDEDIHAALAMKRGEDYLYKDLPDDERLRIPVSKEELNALHGKVGAADTGTNSLSEIMRPSFARDLLHMGVFMWYHWQTHLTAFFLGGGITCGIAALLCR